VYFLSATLRALRCYAPPQAQVEFQPGLRELARLCLSWLFHLRFPVPLRLLVPSACFRSAIIAAILTEELSS
jgi:hypothetical protein